MMPTPSFPPVQTDIPNIDRFHNHLDEIIGGSGRLHLLFGFNLLDAVPILCGRCRIRPFTDCQQTG